MVLNEAPTSQSKCCTSARLDLTYFYINLCEYSTLNSHIVQRLEYSLSRIRLLDKQDERGLENEFRKVGIEKKERLGVI